MKIDETKTLKFFMLLLFALLIQFSLFFIATTLNVHQHTSLWYPPAALTVALYLSYGMKALPISLAAVSVTALYNEVEIEGVHTVLRALVFALGHSMSYAVVFGFLQHLRGRQWNPHRLSGTYSILIGIPVAALLAASVGTHIVYFLGDQPYSIVRELIFGWWLGDTVGAVSLSGLLAFGIHSLSRIGILPNVEMVEWNERTVTPFKNAFQLFLIFILLVTVYFFLSSFDEGPSLSLVVYAIVPVMVWISLSAPTLYSYLAIGLSVCSLVMLSALFGSIATAVDYQVAFLAISFMTIISNAAIKERNRNFLENVQNQQKLSTTSKLLAVNELGLSVLHELSTPIHTLKIWLDLIGEKLKKNEPHTAILANYEKANSAYESMVSVHSQLKAYIQSSEERTGEVDLWDVLETARIFLPPDHKRALQPIKKTHGHLKVSGSSSGLPIVLANIIRNGVEAATQHKPYSPKVWVEISTTVTEVEIAVFDNGTGFDRDLIDKVFEPTFSQKGNGIGIGLAISKNLIEGFGGTIVAYPDCDGFGCIKVKLMRC